MTERLYSADPYLLEFEAAVVARREHEGRPAVILDRTAFYAESGGQPWDTGTLGDARVVAVIEDGPDVLHVLDGPLAGRARAGPRRRRPPARPPAAASRPAPAVPGHSSRRRGPNRELPPRRLTTPRIDLDRLVSEDVARAAESAHQRGGVGGPPRPRDAC